MDIERIAQVLAIQRQGPTLARIGDSVQQSFVLILSHLTQYDPSRAGFSTWVYDWAREAVEQETKRVRFGYGFEAGNGRTASRLIEYLEAIENPRNGRWRLMNLLFSLRGFYGRRWAAKRRRRFYETHSVSSISGLCHLGKLKTSVTPIERDRIGSYVGLDGPAETQRSIAKNRTVGAGVVNRRVRRGTERIKNTAALGALDQDAVDYRDQARDVCGIGY
jgi:hypothetical protein